MSGQLYNYKAVIAYDGSDFFGWQRQIGLPTIQQTIEESIFEAIGEETNVFASSRTDKGVHALAQVISFRLVKKYHCIGLRSLISSYLPPTIIIKSIEEVYLNFIARFAQRQKTYAYIIHKGLTDSPIINRYSWAMNVERLNLEILREMLPKFLGTHDFSCFGKGTEENHNKDPHCNISIAEIETRGNYIIFYIRGNRFLHNMVRRIVFFSLDCANGREEPRRLERIFNGEMCLACAQPAPARGLYLVKVDYDE